MNEAGDVSGITALRGHPLLNEAAVTAVRQWRYSPTLLNGQPVPVITTVIVPFNIEGRASTEQQFVSPQETPTQAPPQQVTNPVAAPKREPIRVGGNVQESKLVYKVEPVYPELPKSARVAGAVILQATINEAGEVYEVKVLRGHPLLDDAAINAVRQWRYSTTLLNGEPAPVVATVTVIFSLSETNAMTVRLDESGTLHDLGSQLEGPALVQKMKESKDGVILQPSTQFPFGSSKKR